MWHESRLLALDTESTGVDTDTARIVTAAAIEVGGGRDAEALTWLSDVDGEPIPADATAVHGITTEEAHADGDQAERVVEELVTVLAEAVTEYTPLVGHNIVYDLTLLDREARRHLDCGLLDILPHGGSTLMVLDTMVLDRRAAPFRRRVSETQGPYQLRTTAETYGLAWDDSAAHGAEYDAMAAARVAWHMGNIAHLPHERRPDWVQGLKVQRFDDLAGVTAEQLHALQIGWAAMDAAGYQRWLREKAPPEKRDPEAVIDGTWPLRPLAAEAVSA